MLRCTLSDSYDVIEAIKSTIWDYYLYYSNKNILGTCYPINIDYTSSNRSYDNYAIADGSLVIGCYSKMKSFKVLNGIVT